MRFEYQTWTISKSCHSCCAMVNEVFYQSFRSVVEFWIQRFIQVTVSKPTTNPQGILRNVNLEKIQQRFQYTFAFWRTKFQRTELQLAPPMQLLNLHPNLMDALEVFEIRKHTQGSFSGTSRYQVYQLSNLHRFDQLLLN